MKVWITLSMAVAFVAMVGCGEPAKPPMKGTTIAKADTKHDGWWCDEHGIPEDECSMCSKKVAAECKAKGDWCNEHKRAKSQCFKCDPKLKEKYAAVYRAKFGKEPPPTEDDDDKAKGK